MKKPSANLIEIGKCTKPHGIKGEFSFHLFSGSETVLEKGMTVMLYPLDSSSSIGSEGKEFKVSDLRKGNKIITRLEGVDDRNQVEEIIPFQIFLDRNQFPEDDGEIYLSDIIGLPVFDHKTGEEIGKVKNIYDNSAQDVLEIRGVKSFDIPFVEAFVKLVDLKERRIEVIVPEFLTGERR